MAHEIEISSPCAATAEARCHCGQLMAIIRKNGVELKCKRCKRLILIPFSLLDSHDGSSLSIGEFSDQSVSRILTHDM